MICPFHLVIDQTNKQTNKQMNTIEDTILKRNVPGRWQNENTDECKDAEGFKSIENNKNQSSVVSYLSSHRNNKTGVKGIYIYIDSTA